MRVNVAQLRRTEGSSETFHLRENFPALQFGNEEYIFQTPMDVLLDVVNVGKSLLVKGKVFAQIGAICSRCLQEFPYALSFEFEDEWVPQELAENVEDENPFIFERDEFNIEERILEHVYLHLPMRFTCAEDCKGLCPICGADRNQGSCACADEVIDPRMEILSKWNKGV